MKFSHLVLAWTLSSALPAFAQITLAEESRLLTTTPAGNDQLGFAVALSADYAVAGRPFVSAANIGGASVFERDTLAQWPVALDLTGSTSFAVQFGFAVDIEGDRLVISEPRAQSGRQFVYVYERAAGAWSLRAQVSPASWASFDRFGESVAISGERIAVGAPFVNLPAGPDAGRAYVFRTTSPGDLTSWVEEAVLEAQFPQAGARFGNAVDLENETLVVGAPLDDSSAVDSGSVYVFADPGSTGAWSQVAKLFAPSADQGEALGASVALDGSRFLAGATGRTSTGGSNSGAVFVAETVLGFWTLTDVIDGAQANESFGAAVALDGNRALVGAPAHTGVAPESGVARLFELMPGGGHTELASFVGCDTRGFQSFGASLALDGDRCLVGAPRQDDLFTDSGAAYVFAIQDGDFERFGFGDGSGRSCPCANASDTGSETGCVNSAGLGARLEALESSSAMTDSLLLRACNLPPGVPALLFSGTTRLQGALFGDGLRVVGGSTKRLGVRLADARGGATWGPGLAAAAGFVAGDVRHFQVWYRDALGGPCGNSFNLSSGVTVNFQ